ncbi:MAG: helix-turn-helix transcriptional regulator [Bacteroidetes bacterium]|nr:helix-turn-helix transcriptional regulator [Bacteroidota bacterium]
MNRLLLALEEAMEAAGISQAEIARKTGKKAQAISRAFNGQQNLTIGTILEIAVSLGKTVRFQLSNLPILRTATEPVLFTQAQSESTVQSYPYPAATVRNQDGSFKYLNKNEHWKVTENHPAFVSSSSQLCH